MATVKGNDLRNQNVELSRKTKNSFSVRTSLLNFNIKKRNISSFGFPMASDIMRYLTDVKTIMNCCQWRRVLPANNARHVTST